MMISSVFLPFFQNSIFLGGKRAKNDPKLPFQSVMLYSHVSDFLGFFVFYLRITFMSLKFSKQLYFVFTFSLR